MRRSLLVLALLSSLKLLAQDTIKIEAADAMSVCTAQRPASLGPCATAPHAISQPNPSYSEAARRSHREGLVRLSLVVGADGNPRDIQIVKTLGDGLDEAAIDAVKQWKFEPGTYQGKAVSVKINVEVSFSLGGGAMGTAPSRPPTFLPEPNREQIRNLFTDVEDAYNRHEYVTASNLARRITSLAPQLSGGWNQLGRSLLELHQLNAAASALEEAVRLEPASPVAYNNLGRVYWQQRRYDEAISQFEEQIALNAQDPYAHANLGMLLRDRKKCNTAIPELTKALAITPHKPNVLLALAECDIDSGDSAKGLSEMDQATSEASAPAIWNAAAYALARRNLELERAQKWSETAVRIESSQLQNISLDHLSSTQLSRVGAIASSWDTLGWIYFLRGHNNQALTYLDAAWALRPLPVIGYHRGQVYETLGRHEEATRAYAMALAAVDSPLILPLNPDESEAVAKAHQALAALASTYKSLPDLLDRARADLLASHEVSVPNGYKATGSARFTLNVAAPHKVSQVRQISGDSAFGNFAAALQAANLPMQIPPGSEVEIPRLGALTCTDAERPCRLQLLGSNEALDQYRKENGTESGINSALIQSTPSSTTSSAAKPDPSEPPDPDSPTPVAQGIATGLLIKRVQPVYPELARQARIEGTVLISATINKTGDVEDLKVLDGPPELVESALEAVRQWKYKPYLLNGEPVAVLTEIRVNYSLTPR